MASVEAAPGDPFASFFHDSANRDVHSMIFEKLGILETALLIRADPRCARGFVNNNALPIPGLAEVEHLIQDITKTAGWTFRERIGKWIARRLFVCQAPEGKTIESITKMGRLCGSLDEIYFRTYRDPHIINRSSMGATWSPAPETVDEPILHTAVRYLQCDEFIEFCTYFENISVPNRDGGTILDICLYRTGLGKTSCVQIMNWLRDNEPWILKQRTTDARGLQSNFYERVLMGEFYPRGNMARKTLNSMDGWAEMLFKKGETDALGRSPLYWALHGLSNGWLDYMLHNTPLHETLALVEIFDDAFFVMQSDFQHNRNFFQKTRNGQCPLSTDSIVLLSRVPSVWHIPGPKTGRSLILNIMHFFSEWIGFWKHRVQVVLSPMGTLDSAPLLQFLDEEPNYVIPEFALHSPVDVAHAAMGKLIAAKRWDAVEKLYKAQHVLAFRTYGGAQRDTLLHLIVRSGNIGACRSILTLAAALDTFPLYVAQRNADNVTAHDLAKELGYEKMYALEEWKTLEAQQAWSSSKQGTTGNRKL